MDMTERLARLGEAAAAWVRPGMIVGLGTGSTADAVIEALGRRVAEGLTITGVPTSSRTEALAARLGIPLRHLDDVDAIDLGIDGADEIAPSLAVVKGRGGALLYEKLVAECCAAYLIVAADEKLVPALGTRLPLPVEIVPVGWSHTAARLARLGLATRLRQTEEGAPYITDGGHYIVECEIGPIADPARLAAEIKAITGVVDHGLFYTHASAAMVVDGAGQVTTIQRPGA